jgi:hypothetical protein
VQSRTSKDLGEIVSLPAGTALTMYTSKQAPIVDPVSTEMIDNSIKKMAGQATDSHLMDSKFHVYVRSNLRIGVVMTNRETVYTNTANRVFR